MKNCALDSFGKCKYIALSGGSYIYCKYEGYCMHQLPNEGQPQKIYEEQMGILRFIYPKWCKHIPYQNELGCWSMNEKTQGGERITEEFCLGCDQYIGSKK